jgi:hypothetical protein
MWRKGKQANLLEAVPSLYPQLSHLFETNLPVDKIFSLALTARDLEMANVRLYNISREEVEPFVTYQGGSVFLPNFEKIQPVIEDVMVHPASNRALQDPITQVWNARQSQLGRAAATARTITATSQSSTRPTATISRRHRSSFSAGRPKAAACPCCSSLRLPNERVIMAEDPNSP